VAFALALQHQSVEIVPSPLTFVAGAVGIEHQNRKLQNAQGFNTSANNISKRQSASLHDESAPVDISQEYLDVDPKRHHAASGLNSVDRHQRPLRRRRLQDASWLPFRDMAFALQGK